jgi:hypothetical protein
MPEELLEVALRVFYCLESLAGEQPDLADLEHLRKAVSGEVKNWLPSDLVGYVIQREIKGLRERRAGQLGPPAAAHRLLPQVEPRGTKAPVR